MEKYIFIKPEDTLFFRDGRPFERGIESFSRSIFPPFPSVFYGALRSACILNTCSVDEYYKACKNNENPENNLQRLIKTVGCNYKLGTLEIIGPFIRGEYDDIYVPMPFDILEVDSESYREHFFKVLPKEDKITTNLNVNLNLAFVEGEEGGENKDYFINLEDLILNYVINFDSEEINLKKIEQNKIFSREYKVGIKINKNNKITESGYLYSAEHVRMNDGYGFLVKVTNDNKLLAYSNYLRLGGDTRVAYYESINNFSFDHLSSRIVSSLRNTGIQNRLKFVLLTPAIFKNGWYPDFLGNNNGNLEGNWDGLKLKLVSAVLGKPLYAGGFDIMKKYPKAMKRAVPAGSVYYFEVKETNDASLIDCIEKCNFTSIESDESYKKQGFGITLIGGW